MDNLEKLIERIEDKILDIQLKLGYLELKVEELKEQNENISYFTSKNLVFLCDIINKTKK